MILFSTRQVVRLVTLWLTLGGTFLLGQTTRDMAVEINASVQATPPTITLQWTPSNLAVIDQKVSRRLKNALTWSSGTTLAIGATSYTDTSVSVGTSYEYRVTRTYSGDLGTAFGYVSSGIRVPVVANRGRVILLVDETMATPLAAELARLASDLTGDGWFVIRQDVSRTASPPTVRASIKSIHNASPTTNTALILFGRIPVPYSGKQAIDGHVTDHYGAWPTDVYYGDMDGTWTDSSVNDTSSYDPRQHNIPGDGKFDQTIIPSDIELQVGRIDLSSMPSFGVSETELLRRYLDRDHAYRHNLGAFANVRRRGLVRDVFGYFGGEAFAVTAWRSFTACIGRGNVDEGEWFPSIENASYLWAYACGGGAYHGAQWVGTTTDYAQRDSRAVFTMLFGSYFGDWDIYDCFLRAPLAGTPDSLGLASCWAGRPHWFFHPMALGETIGYSARITQNNPNTPETPQRGYDANIGLRHNHVALHGDPTLRLYPVKPPADLTASVAPNAVTLQWTASTDVGIEGYLVARANSPAGPFALLQTALVTGTSFVDNTVVSGVSYTYLVRAVKAETSPTGSYLNSSQGLFLTTGVFPRIAVYPPAVNRSIHAGSAVTEILNISNPGALALTHSISVSPGAEAWLSLTANSGTVAPGGVQQIGVNLNATGLALGEYSAQLSIASNAPGAETQIIPVRLTVGDTPFEAWQNFHFGANAPPSESGENSNLDGDAANNLLEYALVRDPRVADTAGFVTTAVNAAGYLQIQFERDATRTDLRYIVEAGSSLTAPWTPIASGIHGAPVIASGAHSSRETGAGSVKTVTVEDAAPVTTFTTRFLRLRVVRD